MATVSIIVPVYNVEEYLNECVESIRNQTLQDIEIILVDDGSPDKCGEMCDEYAKRDARIHVVHQENGGLGDARNAGVKHAQGKYLMFVDSDDWLHREAVQRLTETAEQNQADIVLFDYEGVEPNGKKGDLFTSELPENTVLNASTEPKLIMSSVSAVNKLYRHEFWEQSGIEFPKGRRYEDLGSIPKLFFLAERVIYQKEVLYYYRMREGSIMHSSDFSRNYRDRTAMLESVREFYRQNHAEEQFKNELEYLFFENGYFVPSKEIVLSDRKSSYLGHFREYIYKSYPDIRKNKYIRTLSKKDKILLFLLERKWYGMMKILSSVRQLKDKITS